MLNLIVEACSLDTIRLFHVEQAYYIAGSAESRGWNYPKVKQTRHLIFTPLGILVKTAYDKGANLSDILKEVHKLHVFHE